MAVGTPRLVPLKRAVAGALTSSPVAAGVGRVTGGVVRSRGMRIDTRSDAVAPATRAALLFRTYESAEIRLVRSHLRDTDHLVDLGASLGVVSAAAARLLPDGATVTCVEANPRIAALTGVNVEYNAPQVQVRVVHGAIDYSRPAGEAVPFAAAAQHVASAIDTSGAEAGFTAPAVRLSDLVGPDETFSLVMDIEGAEVGLLQAEAATLARCEQLVAELHATELDGRRWQVPEILASALSLGFEVEASYGNVFVLRRVASSA